MVLSSRVLNVQRELLARFDRISNLWMAYHNSGKYPDDFGREFYHAVGKLLQGHPLERIELYHLTSKIPSIVAYAKTFEKELSDEINSTTEDTQDTKGTVCRKQRPVKKPPKLSRK